MRPHWLVTPKEKNLGDKYKETSVLCIQQSHCTYELTVVMIAYTNPVEAQARPNRKMEGKVDTNPNNNEDSLATD